MAVLASDNFDRGDNADLGAAWTVITSNSNFAIVSNKAQPNVLNVDAAERYSGLVWPDDQYGACVLTPSTSGGVSSGDEGIGLVLRAASDAKTYYRITTDATVSTNNISLSKSVAAAYTNLWSRSIVIADGAILRVEAQGTTIRVYLNGVQLGADATDGSIGAGDPGVFYSSQSDACSLDNWEGGNFLAAATFRFQQNRRLRPAPFRPGLAR